MRTIITASALTCFALGALGQPTRTERAAIANGEIVYQRVGCFACHGTVGHGGAAKRLIASTLPLEAFTTWVRNGSPGWSFVTGMPAFPATVLSDAELADVRAYLASLPAPPAADDIPLLRP